MFRDTRSLWSSGSCTSLRAAITASSVTLLLFLLNIPTFLYLLLIKPSTRLLTGNSLRALWIFDFGFSCRRRSPDIGRSPDGPGRITLADLDHCRETCGWFGGRI